MATTDRCPRCGRARQAKINSPALREAMRAQQLKLYWVAEVSGVDRSTIRAWLRGTRRWVVPSRVTRVARVLNRRPEELLL